MWGLASVLERKAKTIFIKYGKFALGFRALIMFWTLAYSLLNSHQEQPPWHAWSLITLWPKMVWNGHAFDLIHWNMTTLTVWMFYKPCDFNCLCRLQGWGFGCFRQEKSGRSGDQCAAVAWNGFRASGFVCVLSIYQEMSCVRDDTVCC